MRIIERRFLPSSTNTVHAATIEFFNEEPVFAWFGGSIEGSEDSAIYILRDNKAFSLGEMDRIPRWNPVLFSVGERLYLFEKVGYWCDRWATRLHNITNWNDNITEKEVNATAIVLPAGLNGSVKTRPVFFKDLMICGSSVENILDWSSFCEIYKKPTQGNTLDFVGRSNPICIKEKKVYVDHNTGQNRRTMGLIQPSLWINDDVIHSFFRSQTDTHKIYYSCSKKYPFTFWEDPITTEFDNPNSSVDTLFLDGFLYLAYNPSKNNRYPLCIVKIDENMQIVDSIIINNSPKIENGSMEFSYPFLASNNGLLHLVYTVQRRQIEYVCIRP